MSQSGKRGYAALYDIAEKKRVEREQKEVASDEPTHGRLTSQPNETSLANQLTKLDDQLTTTEQIIQPDLLVNQLTNQPVNKYNEKQFPSRMSRKLKGIRLPANKLEMYEDWQHQNRKLFKDFQDMVEFALDWLTSQPVNQLTSQPANQSTTLINKVSNNQLIINDEKMGKAATLYTELTGRTFGAKDAEAYREVSHLDESVILQGLRTAVRRGTELGRTINGFRYAVQCIIDIGRITPIVQQSEVEKAKAQSCDLCSGTGFYYPRGFDGGVAKCTHERRAGG